jgi:hypothetical protein
MAQWLIRTAENVIAGPYEREQVCQLIRDGELNYQDEVCQSNGYWIYLHERDEVLRQLGVEVPKPAAPQGEEVTETGLMGEKTDPTLSDKSASEAHGEPALPELAQSPDSVPEHTSVIVNRAFRQLPTAKPLKRPETEAPAAAFKAEAPVDRPREGSSAEHSQAPANGGIQALGADVMPETGLERTTVWRGFAWLVIAGIVGLLIMVIRVLRAHQG